ncbi:MAG: sensor histidine kinase [Pseudonocardia sp.]
MPEIARPDRGVATAVAVTSWALVLTAVAALAFARPPVTAELLFFAVDVTVAGVYGTVAGLILARRRHPVPWILGVAAIGGGVAAVSYAYTALLARRPELPQWEWLIALQGIAWVPGTIALIVVVPWLVRDHPLGRAAIGVVAGAAVALGFTAVRIAGLDDLTGPLSAAVVVVGLAAAADAAWRWRRGPEAERVGLGWLALGTAVMALSFLPLAFEETPLPWWSTPTLHLAAQAVFPAAVLVAVLRQRMWGLDLAVSRVVLGGLLAVVLGLVYVVVTVAVASLVPGSGIAQVLAAAAVVVALQPSRLWLGRRVHRLVHGEAADPERAVRRLGRHLGGARTADELLGGLVENVAAALRLESATLLVGGGTAATWGTPTGEPVTAVLHHRGSEVGTLQVTLPPGEAFGSRDRRALDELAAVVAAGVALAQASDDLALARDRLTSVRMQERRTIRRELHDGLGPSLAGIRLGLQGARNLLHTDPAAADQLLGALAGELDGRVDAVRTLSHSLLPPALDELGLAPALEELVIRRRETGLAVDLHTAGLGGLPPPVAEAAYGIVVEAVTNVVRHSGAEACRIDVVADDEHLTITVDDDGVGLAPDATAGVGTRSMRERAEEQGGTLFVLGREPHGTRVRASLPLEGS